MPYGLLTPTDVEQLEATLREAFRRAIRRNQLGFRALEIGVCHGDTSRGILEFAHANGAGLYLDFWCVDNGRDREIVAPFEGANLVLGPSEEVYPQVPKGDGFDFVLIDGCHCAGHIALDFLHYGDLVRIGGFVMFHDMAPRAQGKLDWQGHGPKDHPDFGTATREAVRLLGLADGRRDDWRTVSEVHDDQDWGGTLVVERTF